MDLSCGHDLLWDVVHSSSSISFTPPVQKLIMGSHRSTVFIWEISDKRSGFASNLEFFPLGVSLGVSHTWSLSQLEFLSLGGLYEISTSCSRETSKIVFGKTPANPSANVSLNPWSSQLPQEACEWSDLMNCAIPMAPVTWHKVCQVG